MFWQFKGGNQCQRPIRGTRSRNRTITTTPDAALVARFHRTIGLTGRAGNRSARTAPGWAAKGSNSCEECNFPMRTNRFTIFDAVVASKLTNP